MITHCWNGNLYYEEMKRKQKGEYFKELYKKLCSQTQKISKKLIKN